MSSSLDAAVLPVQVPDMEPLNPDAFADAARAPSLRPNGVASAHAAAPPPLLEHELELNGQLANRIVWKALACGLVADGFGWQSGVGLNLAIYLTLVLFSAASVLRLRMGMIPRSSLRLLQLGGVFSFFLILRDSEELQFLNFVACVSCVVLAIAVAQPIPLVRVLSARVRDLVATAMRSGIVTAIGAFLLLFDLTSQTRGTKRVAMLRVVRMAVLSVGVTVAFGALLAAGDPVFRSATLWLVDWNAGTLGTHLAAIAFFSWPVAGLLWGNTAFQRTSLSPATLMHTGVTLRRVDTLAALTALNVLFAVFVATQARVLFGGQAYVLATTGLSLAEYARSGFFTLIVVAVLILSLLLAFNALLDKPGLSASKSMQRLSFSLLSLTGVVLVSAATRMVVYMNAFGASPDRMFAMTIIGALAVVMVWFAMTVLRDRPLHFAFGALVIGWSTLVVFNAANPHALIARNHLDRAGRGELFDANLIALNLSLDVVPDIVAAAEREMRAVLATPLSAVAGVSNPANSRTHACAALGPLAARLKAAKAEHWWSMWNVARWRAERALERSSQALAVCR
ncbi:MAG: DUF4173 domain-containing protein [Phycisphaerae bacterium]|nr:DUF4173 domain-containing protein [Gemmatimonadaceae bacterium]